MGENEKVFSTQDCKIVPESSDVRIFARADITSVLRTELLIFMMTQKSGVVDS